MVYLTPQKIPLPCHRFWFNLIVHGRHRIRGLAKLHYLVSQERKFEMPRRHFGADGLIIASTAIRYGNIFLAAALFYS